MKHLANRYAKAILFIALFVPTAWPQTSISEVHRKQCLTAYGTDRQCERPGATHREDVEVEGISPKRSNELEEFNIHRDQINESLNYLRAVATYLSDAASPFNQVEPKSIAKTTRDIKKHAQRLRSKLDLPNPDRSAPLIELELPTDIPQLRLFLSALSSLLADATQNPSLKGRVLDVIGSVRARNDLDVIIQLSERIKRHCELLVRTEL